MRGTLLQQSLTSSVHKGICKGSLDLWPRSHAVLGGVPKTIHSFHDAHSRGRVHNHATWIASAFWPATTVLLKPTTQLLRASHSAIVTFTKATVSHSKVFSPSIPQLHHHNSVLFTAPKSLVNKAQTGLSNASCYQFFFFLKTLSIKIITAKTSLTPSRCTNNLRIFLAQLRINVSKDGCRSWLAVDF